MKNLIPITLAATLVASGISSAQTPAYSKPSGYVTQTISQGFNLIGIALHGTNATSGKITGLSPTTLTDSAANFSTSLTVGSSYLLEINSGSKAGLVIEVASWTQNSLTIVDNLVASGVVVTDSYSLRRAPTLEEVFGTTNSVLTKSNNSLLADIVWIPKANGQYDRYFLNNSSLWRNAAGGAATSIPFVYLDGIFLQKRNPGTIELVFTGQVKTSATVIALGTGFTLVGNPYPAGTTLQNSGLDASLVRSNNSLLADLVWLPSGIGTYDRYFVNNSGVWRNAAGGAAAAIVPLPSAMFIQRRSASSAEIRQTPPVSYSSL